MTNEYGRLIQRVRKVNRKAALFLVKQFPVLRGRGVNIYLVSPEWSMQLGGAFQWNKTPQGFDYWAAVSRQLGEIKR